MQRLHKIKLRELSLVDDHPANPHARITLFKRAEPKKDPTVDAEDLTDAGADEATENGKATARINAKIKKLRERIDKDCSSSNLQGDLHVAGRLASKKKVKPMNTPLSKVKKPAAADAEDATDAGDDEATEGEAATPAGKLKAKVKKLDGRLEEFGKRQFSSQQRQTLADKGKAMPDGSFPIANTKDLHNAVRAIGRAKNPAAAKAHIKRRAAALGASSALPDSWK